MKIIIITISIIFSPTILLPQKNALIIDHTKVQEFNKINPESLTSASELKLMFRHASVGTTINNGLDCIQGTRKNPKECTEFEPYYYDRRNLTFQPRGNSGWKGKVNDFVDTTEDQIEQFDIFSFKFCYLDGLDEIAEPCGKPFNSNTSESNWNYLKTAYENLETKYPNKIFIWWTLPLTQSGQYCTEQMNSKIRNYCKENGKILFDIADIEAYDTLGNHTTNNQGWEIAFDGYCGEKTGPSCHPNWLASIMLAKAFWYMMVKITENNPVSIQEFNQPEIKLLTNPAADYIEISLPKNSEIKIFNTLGKCVMAKQTSFTTQKIDISTLPNGIYILHTEDITKKFLIVK